MHKSEINRESNLDMHVDVDTSVHAILAFPRKRVFFDKVQYLLPEIL